MLDRITQHLDTAASHYLSTQPDELSEALAGHRTPVAAAAELCKRLLSNQHQMVQSDAPAAEGPER